MREANESYTFGKFRLDVDEHKLTRLNGPTIGSIPDKAFQTLVFLVRNHGRLVTKTDLLDAIWPDTAVEENNLNKSIHAIRQALGEKPGAQKYIETVSKHGYRFIADVLRVDMAGGPTSAENGHAAKIGAELNETSGERLRNTFYFKTAAVIVLIGAAVLGGWLVLNRLRAPQPPILSNSKQSETSKNMPTDSRSPAYDLYVRGKVKVGSENREDTEAAIKVLEEAVVIDPNFAEAYAQLARGFNTMAFKYSSDAERKRFYENAEVAVEKALALNPDLAEAHFARGLILWTNTRRFPHEQAIQSYKRSLALDPNLDETHHQLSLVYSHIGLLDEANQCIKKALEINPNNTLARFRAGVYIAYRGRFDDAIAVFKTIPRDFTPLLVDRSMAEALIQTGRLDDAEALVDDYLKGNPQDEGRSFMSLKALLLAKAGKKKEAEETIARALQMGKGFGHFHHTAYNAASVYAILDEPDQAIRWLEYAEDNGFPNYTYFDNDPNLDNIRNDPRFIEFMTQLKTRWERFKSLS